MNFTKYLLTTLISYHLTAFHYIQEEISGWREDLFTARKSAINLLGIISMSKVGTQYSLINLFTPYLLVSDIVYFSRLAAPGPSNEHFK